MNEIMIKQEEFGLWVEDILFITIQKGFFGKVEKKSCPYSLTPYPLRTASILSKGTGVGEGALGLGDQALAGRKHASTFQWGAGEFEGSLGREPGGSSVSGLQ